MTEQRTYIGDSVYASFDDMGQIWLATNNGFSDSNRIALEPGVFSSLLEYARHRHPTFQAIINKKATS